MSRIHNELIALFRRNPRLTLALDPDVEYIMKVTPNGTSNYAIDTHLRVTPQLEEGDKTEKALVLEASRFNYTGEPEPEPEEIEGPGSKARLLFGSTLKRYDTAADDGCFWFHYHDGSFTPIEKGLVYVAARLIQTHILKITLISTHPVQKLLGVIVPAELEPGGRFAKLI